MQSSPRRRYDNRRAALVLGGRGDIPSFRVGNGRDARYCLRDEWQHEPPYRRRRSLSPPVMRERRLRVTPPMVDRGESYVHNSSRGLDARKQQFQAEPLPYQSVSRGIHHPAPGHDNVHQPAAGYSGEEVGYKYKHLSRLSADEQTGLARSFRTRDIHPVVEGPVLVSSSMDVSGKKMFARGSTYQDNVGITARSFMTLRPEPGSNLHAVQNGFTSGNIRGTSVGNTSRYEIYKEEDLHQNHAREIYRGIDNDEFRFRNRPYLAEAPPMQLRDFGGASGVVLPKDNILATYQEAPLIEHNVTDNITDYRDQPILYDEYSQTEYLNPVNQLARNPMVRKETEDGIYSNIVTGDRGIKIHNQISRHPQEDYSYGEAFHSGYRDSLAEASPEATRLLDYWDGHASFQEHPRLEIYEKERVLEEVMYEGDPSAFRSRPHQEHENLHVREEYGYEMIDEMEAYRERSRSPIPPEKFGKSRYDTRHVTRRNDTVDLDIYDPQSDRFSRKRYAVDDLDEGDPRRFTQTSGNLVRRIGKPDGTDEPWRGKSRANVDFSKRYTGHSQYPPFYKGSGSDTRFVRRGPSGLYKDGTHTSLKRRLRMEPSTFEDCFYHGRRQDLSRPFKLQRNVQDVTDESKSIGDKDLVESSKYEKNDPPEGSEEFKHLTHKAFLRFSKMFSESRQQREKYKTQGKAGSLICFACGSLSKEFVDTHSLVMHTFNSLRVGLRTDHLGLHKALCVLMGWNYSVPPDGAKIYQSQSPSEALSLKYDLIVWPPLVVVHNISIGNKSMNGGPKVVPKEGMEDILKDIGLKGKFTGVCQGKAADTGVLLVKFSPTFSGLREAEKLHNHYADQKRGRAELKDMHGGKGCNEVRDKSGLDAKELLYGYMATVEDLDELDPETLKRCVIKSKKDIEAIADAPLMVD